ncbi:unnamed protein product [Caenorhabditis bovis]|uniref:Uncharacterized protein n=1 Tax=Caenorhabditis bovis TaxID=2654633 RepID=A0A8S1F943_9PELO|nr:unnamed protein product [Caenorhabditis bovis]
MENDFNCSLSYFIFNSFKPHEFYYNCTSNDNVGEIQKPLGIYFISSGLFILILYTLCLIAMAKSDLMRSSCYKIMMLLGILDIICTFTNSLATGFLGYEGATFCSYPRFIFVMGSIGCGCWIGSCLICVILGINRCCDMNPNLKIRFIFQGSRTYIVIGVRPIHSNLLGQFRRFFHKCLYSTNFSPALLILIGQLAWQWSSGSVCVVYLIINRTIRKRVINLLISEGIQKRIHIGTLQSSSLNAARSRSGATLAWQI